MEKDLRSFLTVALATRLITRCITCAFLFKEGRILQFEAVAGFEPSANGIGPVHSVAVTRRLIHGGGYLTDWTRKLLSLSGDIRQSAWECVCRTRGRPSVIITDKSIRHSDPGVNCEWPLGACAVQRRRFSVCCTRQLCCRLESIGSVMEK
jgi:hypothetical protein